MRIRDNNPISYAYDHQWNDSTRVEIHSNDYTHCESQRIREIKSSSEQLTPGTIPSISLSNSFVPPPFFFFIFYFIPSSSLLLHFYFTLRTLSPLSKHHCLYSKVTHDHSAVQLRVNPRFQQLNRARYVNRENQVRWITSRRLISPIR